MSKEALPDLSNVEDWPQELRESIEAFVNSFSSVDAFGEQYMSRWDYAAFLRKLYSTPQPKEIKND